MLRWIIPVSTAMLIIDPQNTEATKVKSTHRNCFVDNGLLPAMIRGKIRIGSLILKSLLPSFKSDDHNSPIKCINHIPENNHAALLKINLDSFSLIFPSNKNATRSTNCEMLVRKSETGRPVASKRRPVK